MKYYIEGEIQAITEGSAKGTLRLRVFCLAGIFKDQTIVVELSADGRKIMPFMRIRGDVEQMFTPTVKSGYNYFSEHIGELNHPDLTSPLPTRMLIYHPHEKLEFLPTGSIGNPYNTH